MKRILLPVLAILIAVAIPAFITIEVPPEASNAECTNDSKYCVDDFRE